MLLAGWLLAAPALAFQPTINAHGQETSWEVMPVYWTYEDAGRPEHLDPEAAEHAVRSAFAAWNAVPGARVRFIEADLGVPEEELNTITWATTWDWSPDILALTSTWSTKQGDIVRFDIVLNAEDPLWSTDGAKETMDLQNAMTHEVGHALGLGHDPSHAEATMAPTARPGETRKRDLHRADQDGARYLYPGQGGAPLACSTAPAGPAPLTALGLAALLGLARRRRTRR